MHNQPIQRAVDALKDHSIAETESEHGALIGIYHNLLETPDRYFVLNDLQSYYDTQKKVEQLYLNPSQWAEMALQNIAAMGPFSIDEAAHSYAQHVWDLAQCPVDPAELSKVREEYSEHDKCRIF
jgi:starch phosphorylase